MKKKSGEAKLVFKDAFMYPFHRAKGMWNILWVLLPIFGWFALGGYGIRIIKGFTEGKFKKLPIFSFGKDMKLGFFMFIKSLPFVLAYLIVVAILGAIDQGIGNFITTLIEILVVPILGINFAKKQTVESFFEFGIVKYVFKNFWDYVVAFLKSILLGVIFLVMCIILVGIPASVFTQNIFLADFYKRRVGKK